LPFGEAKLQERYCHSERVVVGRVGGRAETKIATGPRVIKFGTEVRPTTLLISTGNGVSSYFRSAAIRHFENLDILNFGPFLPNW